MAVDRPDLLPGKESILKNTSIIRNIDTQGRLVLPKDVRASMGWLEETPVEISILDEGVFLKKISKVNLINDIKNLDKNVEREISDIGQVNVDRIKDHLREVLLLLNPM